MALLLATLATQATAAGAGLREQAPRTARLVYTLGEGTDSCPNEEALRVAVLTRLGYDPFQAGARVTLTARIEARPEGFVAHIEMIDPTGELIGQRDLRTRSPGCAELVSTVALALAIAIDPFHDVGVAGPPPPPRQRAAEGEARRPRLDPDPPAPPPAPPPAAASPGAWEARMGVIAALGATRRTLPAASVGAGMYALGERDGWGLRLDADLFVQPGATSPLGRGARLRSALAALSIAPCATLARWSLCAAALVGVVGQRASGVDEPRSTVVPLAEAGLRGAVDVEIGSDAGLRLFAELRAAIVRTGLEISSDEVWSTPRLTGTVGVAMTRRFP